MANVTNISVLDSAATTATVSTLDAFRSNIGTSSLTIANATASNLNATITGTATISGLVTVANATASGLLTQVSNATASNLLAQVSNATATLLQGQVNLNPQTSGGLLTSSTLCTATTNGTVVKGSAGQIYHISATNNTATIAYLKIYDNTTATAGSGTPKWRMMIPGNTNGAGFVEEIANGLTCTTGICFTTTANIADNDSASVGANALFINIGYK